MYLISGTSTKRAMLYFHSAPFWRPTYFILQYIYDNFGYRERQQHQSTFKMYLMGIRPNKQNKKTLDPITKKC